jgi:predicted aspartyl protease
MTIPYDASFDPPAPVLSATLTGVVRRRPQMQLPALIDTGADVTAIPNTVINALHLYAVARIEVEGINANIATVNMYMVRLSADGQPPCEIEVVPTGQPFVILGRDWLKSYYLLLNGPEETFVLSQTRPEE